MSNSLEYLALSLGLLAFATGVFLPIGFLLANAIMRKAPIHEQLTTAPGFGILLISGLVALATSLDIKISYLLAPIVCCALLGAIHRLGAWTDKPFKLSTLPGTALPGAIFVIYYLFIVAYAGMPSLNWQTISPNFISPLALPADALIPFNLSRYILESISSSDYPVVPGWSYLERGPLAGLAFSGMASLLGLRETAPWLSTSPDIYFAYQALLTLLNILPLIPFWFWARRTTHTSPFLLTAIILSAYPVIHSSYYTWPKMLSCYYLLSALLIATRSRSFLASGLCCGGALLAHDSAIFAIAAMFFGYFLASPIKPRLLNLVFGILIVATPWIVHKTLSPLASPRMISFYLFCDDTIEATSQSIFSQAAEYFSKHSAGELFSLHFYNLVYPLSPFPLINLIKTYYHTPIRLIEGLYPVTFLQAFYGLGIGFTPLLLWGVFKIIFERRQIEKSRESGLELVLITCWGALLPYAAIAGCADITITHTWGYPAIFATALILGRSLEKPNFLKATLLGLALGLNLFQDVAYLFFHSPARPFLHSSNAYFLTLSLLGLGALVLLSIGHTNYTRRELSL